MPHDWILTHYTDRENLDRIWETRTLRCALDLMDDCEKACWSKKKRCDFVPVKLAVLRDQQPLTDGIVLCATFADFDEYVQYLNGHVFFWPSHSAGKIRRKEFRKKYTHPKHVGLRCRLSALTAANPKTEILFSPYNSGATPRINPKNSPRGLFQPLQSRKGLAFVEAVVKSEVLLPDCTEYEYEEEKWDKFFPTDKNLNTADKKVT